MPSGGTSTSPAHWTPKPPGRSLRDIVCGTCGDTEGTGDTACTVGLPQTTSSPHGQQLLVPFPHRREVDLKYFLVFTLGTVYFLGKGFRTQ